MSIRDFHTAQFLWPILIQGDRTISIAPPKKTKRVRRASNGPEQACAKRIGPQCSSSAGGPVFARGHQNIKTIFPDLLFPKVPNSF